MYEVFLYDFADTQPQQFTLPLEPVPASRPRVTQHGVFYGKKYTHFKEHAVGPCRSFTGRYSEQPIACLVEHVVSRPKSPSFNYPKGDLDNYDKGPLDAMVKSGLFWKDDVQVVFMTSFKRYTEENEAPGVHVTWFDFDL